MQIQSKENIQRLNSNVSCVGRDNVLHLYSMWGRWRRRVRGSVENRYMKQKMGREQMC
jgi:hypothetical protein